MPARDPLSVRYDSYAGRAIDAAIASRSHASRMFVRSPIGSFRARDAGGLTDHERAFTRSVNYQIRHDHTRWAVTIDWSPVENHGGRWGRYATVRLFTRAAARRYADQRIPLSQRYAIAGTVAPNQSLPGARIDAG